MTDLYLNAPFTVSIEGESRRRDRKTGERPWVKIGRVKVLYACKDTILTKGFGGSLQHFHWSGSASSFGHRPSRITQEQLDLIESAYWWRIAPADLDIIQTAVRALKKRGSMYGGGVIGPLNTALHLAKQAKRAEAKRARMTSEKSEAKS